MRFRIEQLLEHSRHPIIVRLCSRIHLGQCTRAVCLLLSLPRPKNEKDSLRQDIQPESEAIQSFVNASRSRWVVCFDPVSSNIRYVSRLEHLS